LSARSYPIDYPQSSSRSLNLINAIKTCSQKTSNFQKDQLKTIIKTGTPTPKEPEKALEDKFKNLHINLLVLEVLAHAPMYNVILNKYVESLELGKNGSAFIQGIMPKNVKDPGSFTLPCSLAKIVVGEGVTRSIFGVKEIDLGEEVVPYWTTLGKQESYTLRPSTDGIGVIPINLKGNIWESEELIENMIDWNKPPKGGDGAWHTKIILIDPDGEEFAKTFQSIPTTRNLSEKENPSEIIDLDHFHDS
ncbi:hypothetical protein Tco_0216901, partial [Tanacetum coccineum]